MHGPVMVMGFLGTLIGLERAVAYGRRWAFAAPGPTGLGAVALLAGLPTTLAQVALVLGRQNPICITRLERPHGEARPK
jgi:hypothetical protein